MHIVDALNNTDISGRVRTAMNLEILFKFQRVCNAFDTHLESCTQNIDVTSPCFFDRYLNIKLSLILDWLLGLIILLLK